MKVLLSTGTMNFTDEQIKKIRDIKNVELLIHKDEREPLEADIASIEYLINFTLLDRYDIEEFKNLKVIQMLSVGLNLIPVEKVKEKNIRLYTAKDIYSIPIAEFVILKTLEIYKSSRFFEENQKNSTWKRKRNLLEVSGKTVGIVGFGSIGKETAKRFKAFGAKIIGFSRSDKMSEYLDEFYNISALKENLKKCDIVVISIPHNYETHELFDESMFDAMKDNSIFINIARGKIVNEQDLIKKIEEKKFLGVGLDVTYNEPLEDDSKLWGFENVYISPHNSYASDEIENRLFECVYKNLNDFMSK